MTKTMSVEAEVLKGFGEVKVRLFVDGKRYVVRFDQEDFESLEHEKESAAFVRKVADMK